MWFTVPVLFKPVIFPFIGGGVGRVAFCIRTELELSRPVPMPGLCILEFIIIPER